MSIPIWVIIYEHMTDVGNIWPELSQPMVCDLY